jgi:hypothetical protein
MGQKVNPLGFRLGLHLKWKWSWYGNIHSKSNLLSKGVITPWGGTYLTNLEEFVQNIIMNATYTNISKSYRILILSFRLYKGYGGVLYGFLLFNKLTKSWRGSFN